MKITRGRICSVLFPLLLVMLVSCGSGKPGGETDTGNVAIHEGDTAAPIADTGSSSVARDQAVQIALKFLREQPHADQYLADSVRVEETPTDWQVFFLHVEWQIRRPNSGLILVDKKTGAARWQPLK